MVARRARVPAQAYFGVSAVFHYLGPAFAVLLFARLDALGVAWLRIAAAAVVFALWRRPWRAFLASSSRARLVLVAMGVVLGAMNACFYLAIASLPLSTVGAIEFLGPIALALVGLRSWRNLLAVAVTVCGVALLVDVRWAGSPLGVALAFANCGLFVLYIVLGHRLAASGGRAGIDRLGVAMLVALVVVTPVGLVPALPAFSSWALLGAGVAVGICSSVIPYVCDQLAMARLPRASFALLLALLPATATLIGVLVLRQVPSWVELAGVALVVIGVAVHRQPSPA